MFFSLDPVFPCFLCLMETSFEIGPVLGESAAAHSCETGCNVATEGSCAPSVGVHWRCLFLSLSGSDYYKCLKTLWNGSLQRWNFLLRVGIFLFY